MVELELSSLQEQCREIDMVEMYKLINDEKSDDFFTRADEQRPTRAAAGKDNLVKKRSHHEFRKNFCSSRVTDEWNGLPDNIKEATTVSSINRL